MEFASRSNLPACNRRWWRRLPAQNLIQTKARTLQSVKRIPQRRPFIKVGTNAIFYHFCRAEWPRNRQKGQMRGDNDRFSPKSRCRLSYQACPIPRIVHPSGMAGLRGPAVRNYF
jgi:hypothetical protein